MYLMSTKANILPGLTNDKFPTPLKLLETNIRRLRVNDLNKPSQLAYSQNERCQITAQGATANVGENFLSRRTDKPKRCLLHRDCWDDSKRQGQKTWRISKTEWKKKRMRGTKKGKRKVRGAGNNHNNRPSWAANVANTQEITRCLRKTNVSSPSAQKPTNEWT